MASVGGWSQSSLTGTRLRPGYRPPHRLHLGSRFAAKPIIDLMPLVSDLAELDRLRGRVEALGYGWHGELGITGRRYCTLDDPAGVRAAQLHFFQLNSPHVERHIALRDYLRAHPEVARAYENEKRRAQSLYPDDSHRYTDEKAAWIRDAEVEAVNWYAEKRASSLRSSQ